MAHGTLLSDDDIRHLAARGTAVSHCPLSNFFFGDACFRCALGGSLIQEARTVIVWGRASPNACVHDATHRLENAYSVALSLQPHLATFCARYSRTSLAGTKWPSLIAMRVVLDWCTAAPTGSRFSCTSPNPLHVGPLPLPMGNRHWHLSIYISCTVHSILFRPTTARLSLRLATILLLLLCRIHRVNHALQLGLKVGLGTDVAGGISPSMLTAQRMAVVNSRCLRAHKLAARGGTTVTPDMEVDVITFKEALWLATVGGAQVGAP